MPDPIGRQTVRPEVTIPRIRRPNLPATPRSWERSNSVQVIRFDTFKCSGFLIGVQVWGHLPDRIHRSGSSRYLNTDSTGKPLWRPIDATLVRWMKLSRLVCHPDQQHCFAEQFFHKNMFNSSITNPAYPKNHKGVDIITRIESLEFENAR
jgi:hypothetical protein